MTLSATSMFPRVAFEYGADLVRAAHDPLRDLRVLDLRERHVEHHADLEPALLGRATSDTWLSIETSPTSTFSRRPSTPIAPSKHAA